MAIKVIKRGVIPEEVPRNVTCHHCKSELQYLVGDVQSYYDQRDQRESYNWILCPICKATVYAAS